MDLTLDTKVGHVRAMRSRESALCGFVVPAGRAWIQLAPRLQRESPEAAAPLLIDTEYRGASSPTRRRLAGNTSHR